MVTSSLTRCVWNTTKHLQIYLSLQPICLPVALPLMAEVVHHTTEDVDLHLEADTIVAVETHPLPEAVAILTLLF